MFSIDKVSFVMCFPFLSAEKPMKFEGAYLKVHERRKVFLEFLEGSGFMDKEGKASKVYDLSFRMKGGFNLMALPRLKLTRTLKKKVVNPCPVVDDIPAEVESRDNHNTVKIEFNPNNIEWRKLKVFWRMMCSRFPWIAVEDTKFNRLDIACDYHRKLDPFLFWNKARKYVIFGDYDRGTESHYLGAMESEKLIRIYDKKQERRKNTGKCNIKGHWWRVELVCSPHKGLLLEDGIKLENPFLDLNYIEQDDIDLTGYAPSQKAWVKAILRGAKHSSINEAINFFFSESDEKERRRKKELMAGLKSQVKMPMPEELFEEYWGPVWLQFRERFLDMWEAPHAAIRRRYMHWFEVYRVEGYSEGEDFK